MITKTHNITEENATKLEMMSRLLGKSKSRLINDLISEHLTITSGIFDAKFEEISKAIKK